MEKLVSMKKLVSLGLVFVLAAVFAISAFAAPADAEEIVPLSRGSYYLTSGYTTIASVSTGLGTSSIEVYNALLTRRLHSVILADAPESKALSSSE